MSWNEEIKKQLGHCGTDVRIGQYVVITNPKGVFLGDHVRIDPFTLITTGLKAGNYCRLCSHVVLSGGSKHTVTLNNWNFVGYGSKLFCVSEDYSGEGGPVIDEWNTDNIVTEGGIVFNDYAGVASDVMVFPQVNLPEGCCIGASSFLYTAAKLEEWSVYYGRPPQLKKKRNKNKVLELAVNADRRIRG